MCVCARGEEMGKRKGTAERVSGRLGGGRDKERTGTWGGEVRARNKVSLNGRVRAEPRER